MNATLKDYITRRILPRVETPGQYVGGELNAVVKDRRGLRGTVCLAFPDAYTIGMSHHGLQVLYDAVNRRPDWACERVFAPWPDMERLLREHGKPLFSLETCTPVGEFDVLGFTLQYDLCATNVLTILDLAGIPLHGDQRTDEHPLVIAGGPGAQSPEPMAPFVDLFVLGDGEETLVEVCDRWVDLRSSGLDRQARLLDLARRLPYAYVPSCYEPRYDGAGRALTPRPRFEGVPEGIEPAVVRDLDAWPLPVSPVVPNVECVHDRIAIEIMRGCPWRCRFCQASPAKRPLRYRKVETIVEAALESYRRTGYNEISLLSLSTSDYPLFDELMVRMQETFRPLGVSVAVPSLRVNEELRVVTELMNTDRHSSLTFAPEAAREDMREQIGKPIRNEDLLNGCRLAFQRGFSRIKLYFMCGLPGERPEDLDGILELCDTISRLGKEVSGRFATVVANVSNFVPKPHTPFQWNAMQTRDYFRWARQYLWDRRRWRTVELKCHDIETSLLEGVFSRGDRRLGAALEAAWRRGARFDSWSEHFDGDLWWQTLAECGIDLEATLHTPYPIDAELPWDVMGIRQGREYLAREQVRAAEHLALMKG